MLSLMNASVGPPRGKTKPKSTVFSIKLWEDQFVDFVVFCLLGPFRQVKLRWIAHQCCHDLMEKTFGSLFGFVLDVDSKNALVWIERVGNDSYRMP